MLRRRGGDLPLASGGRTPPRELRQINLPKFTVVDFFSWGWTLIGIVTILFGIRHCSNNSVLSRFHCAKGVCSLRQESGGIPQTYDTFPSDRLIKASVVQLKEGIIVEPSQATTRRNKKRNVPQTYGITWKIQNENEDGESITVPMTKYGLGKRVPRKQVAEIMKYVRDQTQELDIEEKRWFSSVGIVCMVFGVLLLLMRVAVGDLRTNPTPQRTRRAVRRQPR